MDKQPQVIKKSEYEKYNGREVVRILHGYHGKTTEEAYNNTLYGKIQYSESAEVHLGEEYILEIKL